MLYIFSLTGFVWLLFMFKAGQTFSGHGYYIVPFVPIMALITAYGLTQLKKYNYQLILILIICLEGILNQMHDFVLKQNAVYQLSIEIVADKISNRNDLVIVNGSLNPVEIYLSHRKGWTVTNDELTENGLKEMKEKGAKYLFIDKHTMPDANFQYTICYTDSNFIVYNLKP